MGRPGLLGTLLRPVIRIHIWEEERAREGGETEGKRLERECVSKRNSLRVSRMCWCAWRKTGCRFTDLDADFRFKKNITKTNLNKHHTSRTCAILAFISKKNITLWKISPRFAPLFCFFRFKNVPSRRPPFRIVHFLRSSCGLNQSLSSTGYCSAPTYDPLLFCSDTCPFNLHESFKPVMHTFVAMKFMP